MCKEMSILRINSVIRKFKQKDEGNILDRKIISNITFFEGILNVYHLMGIDSTSKFSAKLQASIHLESCAKNLLHRRAD